jgi:hypothetical protein
VGYFLEVPYFLEMGYLLEVVFCPQHLFEHPTEEEKNEWLEPS